MAEQASLWDQTDLLALVLPAEPRGPQEVSAGIASPETTDDAGRAKAPAAAPLAASAAGELAELPGPLPIAAIPASTPLQPSSPAAVPFTAPVAVPPLSAPATAPPPALPQLLATQRATPVSAGQQAPERLLILDTETTALSPEQGCCIEVGAVLFHVPSRAVLQQISFLLPSECNPAEAINGIAAAVTLLPQPREAAQACLLAMAASAEAVVAHNAAFDRQWFGHGPLPELGLPWICSMEDMRWPVDRQLRPNPSVRDLALAYGVPVWAAHRALTDCLYLVHVFQRCPELEALLIAAREPRQLHIARLSYAERHLAREAGFRWNDPVPSAWSRRLSAAEAAALPFPVVPVEPALVPPLPAKPVPPSPLPRSA
ncbi:MAG: 3'-5' exonuclease [Cyanobium sp.]